MKINSRLRLLGWSAATIGLFWSTPASAKDIAIAGNNTPYSQADVQKLAGTAVKMGVKEPVSLQLSGGKLTVSGSSNTSCTLSVGSGAAPQIGGISCK
ncbi:hypothetical protein [Snodgrassella sp. CFCC 13594]|uniref:hypothetical protein n=1 Tax=Snodgrassella sp. CFCC 13594 TaxID=1775559 RepID=UPI000836D17F|nr:hypothetical protein [Snodgrassella sp. CFCC 13594]